MPARPPRLLLLLTARVALLSLILAACSEQVKPTAVHIIDVSSGAERIEPGGSATPAAAGDVLAVGAGVKLRLPPGGHAYVFVRETRIVSYLGGDASWSIDDLLVLDEPATDVSIEEQLSALQRDKRSPTVSDARVAAFHQGAQAAVTVGHEERRASKGAASEKLPSKTASAKAQGAAPAAVSGDALSEAESVPAKDVAGRDVGKKDAANPAPAVQQRAPADADKPVPRAQQTLPRAEGARAPKEAPKRLTKRDVKRRAGTTRGLGLGGAGAGHGAGGRPPGGKAVAPMVKASPSSDAGVVLELKGAAAVTRRAASALKAASAAVQKCAAVKHLKDHDALEVTIQRRRGKTSLSGSTPCVHKALSAIRDKVPAGARLRVVIRPAPAGR